MEESVGYSGFHQRINTWADITQINKTVYIGNTGA